MSHSTEDRWAELADRSAQGEVLNAEEQRERARLERLSDVCTREATFYSVLERALWRVYAPASADDPLIQAALHAVEFSAEQPNRQGARRMSLRWRKPLLASGFVASCAIAVAIWFGSRSSAPELVTRMVRDDHTTSGKLQLSSGNVLLDGELAQSGTLLREGSALETRTGRTCLTLPRGVITCAGPETRLTLERLGDHQQIRVLHGHVASILNKQPKGMSFRVATPSGVVTAVGTMFGVVVDPTGTTLLRVEEGKVMARGFQGQKLVERSQRLHLETMSLEDLDEMASLADKRLLSAAELWSRSSVNRLILETHPSGAEIRLDGAILGQSPVSVDVPSGTYELHANLPGHVVVSKTLRFRGGSLTEHLELQSTELPELAEHLKSEPSLAFESHQEADTRDPEAETPRGNGDSFGRDDPSRAATSRVAMSRSPDGKKSATLLLQQAGTARSAARYGRAVQLYQELQSRYPESPEARAAILSMAELQLSQLKRPGAALRSFEAYLRSGGRLAAEAHYGKIRALRALGRSEEERKAIVHFLSRYPSTAYAPNLQKRLQAL